MSFIFHLCEVGTDLFVLQGGQCIFYLPCPSADDLSSCTAADIISNRQISCVLTPHYDLPHLNPISSYHIFSQSRSLEHQRTCPGLHHGQRRHLTSIRHERNRRRGSVLWSETRILVQFEFGSSNAAHRLWLGRVVSTILGVARKHGVATELGCLCTAEHVARRGRRSKGRIDKVSLLHNRLGS